MVTRGRTPPPKRPLNEDEQPSEPPLEPSKPEEDTFEAEQPAEPRYAEGAATMMSQTRIGPQTRADLSEMMRKALEHAQAEGKSVEEQGQAVRDAVARYNAGED